MAEVECQNYFCKIGWIVLIRSDFTPYPSAALLSPLRVLNPLSSLSSSPGFLVVGFRRTFRVSLPPLITVFYHPVFMLSEESFYCGTILVPCLCLPVFSDATTSSTPDPMQSRHHSFVSEPRLSGSTI